MQYTIAIDQVKSLEWGITLAQAHIFAFIYTLPSWADAKVIDGEIYHRITKQHIANKLPLITCKPDTVKKYLKVLVDKGLIVRKVVDKTELWVKLSPKGKQWNVYNSNPQQGGGDIHPQGGGDKHPQGGGDIHPPNTINNNTINNNTSKAPATQMPDLPKFVDSKLWNDFLAHRKKRKAPNTERAINLLLKKLNQAEEHRSGLANEVIEYSYLNGYTGLFLDKFCITNNQHGGGKSEIQPKITKEYIESNARPGETWEAAKMRLTAAVRKN